MSVITKRGRPTAVAVPFSARLLDLGLDQELALVLFGQGLLTMERAAKLAGLTRSASMDLLAETGAVAVEYPVDELDGEMQVKIRCPSSCRTLGR